MMTNKKKVAVLVAAHCAPKILKMTLGTWLSEYDQSYDVDVYVSVHKNYHHYHPGLQEIMDMEPFIKVVPVDEMNWGKYPEGTIESVFRYSEAHMRNISRLMEVANEYSSDITHVAVIDHDLVFKQDFIDWATGKDCDLVCSLFEDRWSNKMIKTGIGIEIMFAPKPSAWHLVMGRRMIDMVLKSPGIILPGVKDGKCFDSMSFMYHEAVEHGMNVCLYPENYMKKMVEHLWMMSFNYGQSQSPDDYRKKLAEREAEYDKMFPKGIGTLLEKLKRRV